MQKKKKQTTSKKPNLKAVKTTSSSKVTSIGATSKGKRDAGVTQKKQALNFESNLFMPLNLKEMMMNMGNTKNFEKMSQDAANISKETMEACQKSATILAKNSQDCMASYMSMMQSAAEKQGQLMKEMLSKKTINEMSETLQSASQDSFNDMMQNMSKLSEQSIKAVMDSYEPLNNQVSKMVKKASDTMAA